MTEAAVEPKAKKKRVITAEEKARLAQARKNYQVALSQRTAKLVGEGMDWEAAHDEAVKQLKEEAEKSTTPIVSLTVQKNGNNIVSKTLTATATGAVVVVKVDGSITVNGKAVEV